MEQKGGGKQDKWKKERRGKKKGRAEGEEEGEKKKRKKEEQEEEKKRKTLETKEEKETEGCTRLSMAEWDTGTGPRVCWITAMSRPSFYRERAKPNITPDFEEVLPTC